MATYTIPSVKALLDDPAILEAARACSRPRSTSSPTDNGSAPCRTATASSSSIHDAFTAVGLGQMDAPSALLQAEQQINQMIDEVAGP